MVDMDNNNLLGNHNLLKLMPNNSNPLVDMDNSKDQ